MTNAGVYGDKPSHETTCSFSPLRYDEAHRNFHELSDMLDARGKTIGEQGVTIANLLHQVSSLREKNAALEQTNREQEEERGALSRESEGATRLAFALQASLGMAARTADEQQRTIDSQQRRIQHLKDDKEFLKDERNKLRQEVEELRALHAELHSMIEVKEEGPDIGWTVVELSNRPRYQVQRHVYIVTLATEGEITPETVATAKSMAEMTAAGHYVDKVNKGYDGLIHYSTSLPTYNTLPQRGVTFVVTLTLSKG